MSIGSNLSGHWTDDELIDHLYGVGRDGAHLEGCTECRLRLKRFETNRCAVERSAPSEDEVGFEFLAAQRRKIYARLEPPVAWRVLRQGRRVVSAGATLLVIGGAALMYEESRQARDLDVKVSDAELAADVSQVASNPEPSATAPLQSLFEE